MANTKRTPTNFASAVQQSITSGGHFDGTFPTGDSPLVNYTIYKYAAQAAGGLFFWDTNESLVVSQFHVDLGAPGDINLFLVTLDPASVKAGTPTVTDTILIEQVSGARYLALDEARFKTILLPYQGLQLITTASAAAQIAQCVAALERTYIR